jgi:predicted nucleic acid-binding Zn ribbon protein
MSSNEYSMGQGIQAVMRFFRLTDKYRETRIISSWEEIMGKMISSHTISLKLNGTTLRVNLDSSVLRKELSISHDKVCEKINESFGEKVIDKIIFE